ncbi:MAG: translocation/assembly module TamB domain-containing protein [Parvularculaceae bacterium]
MVRALRIMLITLAAFAGAVFLGAAGMLYTPPGRAFLSELIEAELADMFGGETDIGALSGALPRRLVLEDIVLSEDGAPWLTVERIELAWRPFLLLRGRLDIDRALARNAALIAPPPQNEPDTGPPRLVALPDDLPNIRISDLQIENFSVGEAIAGRPHRLNGSGRLSMGGGSFDAVLRAKTNGGHDNVYAAIRSDPENDRLYTNIRVESSADGLIAALIGSDAPIRLEAVADSPLSDCRVNLSLDAGDYGRLEARLASNMLEAKQATLNAALYPGRALDGLDDELGEEARIDARLAQKPGGATIEITRFVGAIGEISGVIDWTIARRALNRLSVTFDAQFLEPYRPDLLTYLGTSATLTADIVRLRRDYRLEMKLAGDRGQLSISDGRTDMRQSLTGALNAVLQARDDAPTILQEGAALAGALRVEGKQAIALDSFGLSFGDAKIFAGDVTYDRRYETLDLQGAATAPPALIAALAPSAKTQEAVLAQIDLSGPLDRLTVKADIDAPSARIGDHLVPAATVEVALAGLPSLPTGEVSGRAVDGSGRFDLALRSAASGRIAFPRMRFAGEGFALSGAGAFDPGLEMLTLNLDYKGAEHAAPLPGVTLAGAFTVNGTLARSGAGSNFVVNAHDFAVNETAVSSLIARASGPADRLDISADIGALSAPGAPLVRDLSLSAVANIKEEPVINLNAFEAVIGENHAKLVAPATITLGEAVAINRLRAQWGETGAIALDGAFSSGRWRADANVSGAPIPGAAGLISFSLDLDTDRAAPARGVFEAKSLLTRMEDAQIGGAMDWNGRRLRFSSIDREDKALAFDITLPVLLNRADRLSINIDGPLEGRAHYSGALEVVAAYLPASLQSLEGVLEATLELGGTLDAPSLAGRAAVSDAAYTELRSGLSLAGIHADARAERKDGATVIAFNIGGRGAGQMDKDTIKIDGAVTLDGKPTISAEATFDKATVSAGPVSAATTSGTVKLSGPLDAIAAAGELTVHSLDAEIVAPKDTGLASIDVVIVGDGAGEPAVLDTPKPPLTFDVRITADDRIFVRGRGLESEWSVDTRAIGDAENPVIVGSMSLRRGWFDFSGRRFNLTEGGLVFDELVVNDPLISARAEHKTADGVTAIIVVSGRASAPKIALQSSPALPAEDVMALVLFGKPAQELTALESLQAAQALAALGGVGPLGGGMVGSVRQALRLDLLNFDVDPESGGGSLTVGKYVASGLFVSASQDAQSQNGSFRIQYEITNSIAVETEMKQDGEQTVSANWKRDF